MQEIVRLFAQILLLRRGPQDLPASRLLLALTLAAYVAVNLLVSGALPALKNWPGPAQLLVDTAFTLLWYVALLQLAGRRERILQTVTAMFGFQILLAPPLILSGWLDLRVGEDTLWHAPLACALLLLFGWLLAASSHVVRAALEWSTVASIAIVLLQTYCGLVLLLALFPSARA
jgi:hypothetical protein